MMAEKIALVVILAGSAVFTLWCTAVLIDSLLAVFGAGRRREERNE